MSPITPTEALEYEIAGSWFAAYVSIDWIQSLVSQYYAYKTLRKYKRYVKFLTLRNQLKQQ